MSRAISVFCFGLLTIAPVLFSTRLFAQNKADPFGSLLRGRIDVAQLVPVEPAPEATLPADPVPLPQIAPQAKAALPAGAPDELCRCVGEDTSAESAARIRKALRAPLKDDGLEYTDQPLEEAIGLIQEAYSIPIKLDTTALEEVNKQPDQSVNVNLHGISLDSALRLMLHDLGLTYVVRDEVLLITTPDQENQLLQTCVYDVRDLLHDGKKGNDFDSLIDSIVSCIATESWAENGGGESEIRPLQPGFLIISQTQAIHNEIRSLLNTIRQLKSVPVAGMTATQTQTEPAEEVVTEFYPLQFVNATVDDALRDQVRNLIVKALPEERWEGRLADGQPVLLAVLNDRVVLRHKRAVQEKVEQLLLESGMSATRESGRGGGRRGGSVRSGISGRNDRQLPPK